MLPPTAKSDTSLAFPSAFSSYVPRNRKVYGCICISPCNRVLLVKGKQSGKWSLPKGHMEGKESDLQCALRELFEETGIVPDVQYTYYKKFSAGGYFIFFLNSEPIPYIRYQDEIADVDWVEFPGIKELTCNLDLNNFCRWIKTSTFSSKLPPRMDSSPPDSMDLLD